MSWTHAVPAPPPGWYVPPEVAPKSDAFANDFREEVREGFRSVMAEMNGLRGEMKDLRGEMKDLRGEMKEVRGDVRHLEGEVKDLRDRVSDVRERVGVHGQSLRSMQWFVGMTIALGVGISGIYATYSTNMAHARAQAIQRAMERGAAPATNPATQVVAPLARPVP